MQVEEEMLPIGELITAVGMLHHTTDSPDKFQRALRRDGQMLVLRPEILTHKPLQRLIDEAQGKADAFAVGATVSCMVAAGLLAGAAVAHHKHSRSRRP
ncbi:hypothetical protein ABPG75_000091 [Micractinium tetrahymenae]